MTLTAYQYTNIGGRPDNQDAADYRIDGESAVFVVADGLGGHRGGDQASELVRETLITAWEDKRIECLIADHPAWDKWLCDNLADANKAVLKQQEVLQNRMKSTATVLMVEHEDAIWASVGDTRLYCLSAGMVTQISRDHSVSYKKFLGGEIMKDDINFDEDRSSLLRVVGDENRCLPESGVLEGVAAPGTAFLLCSDGFWEYLYEQEILFDYLKSETPEDWVRHMLLRILPRVQADNDNLTCIAVFVE